MIHVSSFNYFHRFLCGSKGQVTLEKEWSTVPKPFAYQSIAKVKIALKNLCQRLLNSADAIKCVVENCKQSRFGTTVKTVPQSHNTVTAGISHVFIHNTTLTRLGAGSFTLIKATSRFCPPF